MAKAQAHSTDYIDSSASDVAFAAERTPGITFESCASANYAFGSKVEVVSEREWKTQEEAERFYNERLDIEVHQTTDKNAPLFAEAGVNGHMVWFPRGVRVNGVPRKFVEALARSQITAYKTQQVRNPNADDQMHTSRNTAACYGFSVIRDQNPRGRTWLERVSREG
jgi:hypothetical protein